MRQRNVKNCDDILLNSTKYIRPEDLEKYIKESKFSKICLEIGIGKGSFIFEKARRHKDNLYIGIELNKGVVALATKKISRLEKEANENLTNLRILDYNAIELESVLKEIKLDRIFLNFSDPWPKKRHEKRRLTSNDFLKVYKKILKDDGVIEFKTDNRGLFEYSLQNMNENNISFKYISLNLHEDIDSKKLENEEPNIMTEYEEKFSKNGPIYKLIASFK